MNLQRLMDFVLFTVAAVNRRQPTRDQLGYSGRSLAGFAAWQAGHAIGRTMRWAGMGAE